MKPSHPARLHRPMPLFEQGVVPVNRKTPVRSLAAQLREGETRLVTDHYRTGVDILAALRASMHPPKPDAAYATRKDFERRYREAASRLLAPVEEHRLALEDAAHIGFLAELYPEHPTFLLPFVEAQELFGAWQRYSAGIHLAVLGHRVHPFYGTYVPTRTSHLELFGTWLSQYQGSRDRAIDVGTGCGVLAFMLRRAGFGRLRATDHNPNAIESVRRDLLRLPTGPAIDLEVGDLLGKEPSPVDLVVFNPPWMQGRVEGLVDGALYFEAGLFERFFDQVIEGITPEGRVVLLFSNIMQLVQPSLAHPILTELERGRFRLIRKMNRKVKPSSGPDGRRRRTRERVEVWELGAT